MFWLLLRSFAVTSVLWACCQHATPPQRASYGTVEGSRLGSSRPAEFGSDKTDMMGDDLVSAADKCKEANKKDEPTNPGKVSPPWTAYLWWPFGLYLFWAQATVCDEYFVPSVQVCSDTFKIPEDVAGATLMALGCNGPELAVNVISIFITKSAVGVGTIVGSDIFNLLIIGGFATLCAPSMPVQLDASKVTRDVLFYTISIILLVFVIHDCQVMYWQAGIMSAMVAVYGLSVAYWSKLDRCFGTRPSAVAVSDVAQSSHAGIEASHSRPDNEVHGQASLEQGITVRLRRGARVGRFQYRISKRTWAKRRACLDPHTGTLKLSPCDDDTAGTIERSMSSPGGASLEQPSFSPGESFDCSARECLMVGGTYGRLNIPMKDIVTCEAGEDTTFSLEFTDRSADGVAALSFNGEHRVTLEFQTSTLQERDLFVSTLSGRPVIPDPSAEDFVELVEEHRHVAQALDPHNRTCKEHIFSIFQWLCFPVLLALTLTIPTCFVPSTRKRWPLTFCMAMVWLSFFSYWICVMADTVHELFGIPSALLGLTLTSIGTSFPNMIASVIVARQGQGSMAIANALGSNIQNVFLALGFPWFANALLNGGYFLQSTEGIKSGVICMAGSLLLFIGCLAFNKCRLGRPAAYIFLATYTGFCVYTVLDSYEVL